jgi:hypothetical protein
MNIISLGAGVQSTAMLLMADRGELMVEKFIEIDGENVNTGELEPIKVDCAIFCDTGWEPKSVYEHLEKLIQSVSIPVYVVSKGNIKQDLIDSYTGKVKRFASIPFFVKNKDGSKGIGRRQCTNEYKIVPFRKKARELMGLKKFKRAKKNSVRKLLGITTDEISRVKPSQEYLSVNTYPFIDMRWSRNDCKRYLKLIGWGDTPKSACIGCPFHSNRMWADMKKNHPDDFADAVQIDNMLRSGIKKLNGEEYMHNSQVPLSEAFFTDTDQTDLFEMECEGMCGL